MKSSLNHRIPAMATQGAMVAVGAMLLGLFLSRALLSIGIFVFFLMAPLRLGWRDWIRRTSSDPLVWIFGSWWLLPVVSGLWSTDQRAWMDVVRIKLPLLLLSLIHI